MYLLLFLLACLPVDAAPQTAVGLTSTGKLISATLAGSDAATRPRILLIGGLDGSPASAAIVARELAWFEASSRQRNQYAVAAIELANPDKAKLAFPPTGDAYRNNPEAHSLWRWTALWAPDLVVIVGPDPAGLAKALPREKVAGLGSIPALRTDATINILAKLEIPKSHSQARLELERRNNRTPMQVALQMEKVYGNDLAEAVYIPAVAVAARLRLDHLEDVQRIAAPYASREKNSLDKATGSHLAGHLLFADLADATHDPRYVELVKAAANLGFNENGQMKESMPFHNQMSDSVFMGCPILVRAGKLTGDAKYFDMTLRHFRFMRNLDLRTDRLWRHSPKDEAAWGRGNGFAILGMALSLSDLPESHPAFPEIRESYRELAAALRKHQDDTGMWRQVVDLPGSYRELTATCIISFSLLRGVRRGWLDSKTFQPLIDRAWNAVKLRVGAGGELIDVCESTGAQASLHDYLHRKAILGRDPRGGAMVLLLATELAGR